MPRCFNFILFFVFGSIKPLNHQLELVVFLFKYFVLSETLFTFTIH